MRFAMPGMMALLVGCAPEAVSDLDGDGVAWDVDCDDSDESVGAPQQWFLDRDGDGVGGDEVTEACSRPDRHVDVSGDCDDTDAARSPDLSEVCDGADNDCDGDIDEGFDQLSYFIDYDGDGYGDPETEVTACENPGELVEDGTDCDDRDSSSNPGEDEVWYDGIDNDCSDDTADGDQDGDGAIAQVLGGPDCDDLDGATYPGAEEIWYDGTDQDCAGDSDFDQDGDGFESLAFGGSDCEDEVAEVHPDATEVCNNGFDDDCDGTTNDCVLEARSLTGSDIYTPAPGGTSAFALRVTGRGDLDGDGFADVVVGMRGSASSPSSAGAVFVGFGATSGYHRSQTIDGVAAGDEAETALIVGDTNGDGFDDLVAIAQYANGGGDAYLVYGPASITSFDQADHTITSGASNEMASLGDIDQDGLGTADFAFSNPGAVRLQRGGSTGVSELLITPPASVSDNGYVHGQGPLDANGDGIPDLLVGYPHATGSVAEAGLVALEYGPISGSGERALSPDVTISGAEEGARFGLQPTNAGDVDGDGYMDLFIGSQRTDNPSGVSDSGAAFLFAGGLSLGTSLTTADANATLYGERSSGWFGYYGLAGDCDVNNDGRADLIATDYAEDSAYVFYGPVSGAWGASMRADVIVSDAGSWSSCVGDVNADGVDDFGATRTGAGVGIIYGLGL